MIPDWQKSTRRTLKNDRVQELHGSGKNMAVDLEAHWTFGIAKRVIPVNSLREEGQHC